MEGFKTKSLFGKLFFGSVILVFGLYMVWHISRPDTENLLQRESQLHINAIDLIALLEDNQIDSTILYSNNIVEITGTIKEINNRNNRTTIILNGGKKEHPSIICDMLLNQEEQIKNFSINDTIVLRGMYKGFLKDAIFLNCIVTHETAQ